MDGRSLLTFRILLILGLQSCAVNILILTLLQGGEEKEETAAALYTFVPETNKDALIVDIVVVVVVGRSCWT